MHMMASTLVLDYLSGQPQYWAPVQTTYERLDKYFSCISCSNAVFWINLLGRHRLLTIVVSGIKLVRPISNRVFIKTMIIMLRA